MTSTWTCQRWERPQPLPLRRRAPTLPRHALGSAAPSPSSRQQVTILFYSDTNYRLDGFNITVSGVTCDSLCSNGACHGRQCRCDQGWTGMWCNEPLCPNDCRWEEERAASPRTTSMAPWRRACCSFPFRCRLIPNSNPLNSQHGVCDEERQRCVCEPGRSGADCSQVAGTLEWYTASPADPKFPPRMQAASAFIAVRRRPFRAQTRLSPSPRSWSCAQSSFCLASGPAPGCKPP